MTGTSESRPLFFRGSRTSELRLMNVPTLFSIELPIPYARLHRASDCVLLRTSL